MEVLSQPAFVLYFAGSNYWGCFGQRNIADKILLAGTTMCRAIAGDEIGSRETALPERSCGGHVRSPAARAARKSPDARQPAILLRYTDCSAYNPLNDPSIFDFSPRRKL